MKQQLHWGTDTRYRAFFGESPKQVSLVSSHLSDDATGVTIDDVMLMVLDREGGFCDFEITLQERSATRPPLELDAISLMSNDVFTWIDLTSKISWSYDYKNETLQIRFSDERPVQWIELNSGRVILGLGIDQVLQAIHCPTTVRDPFGKSQEEWLREISS